MSNKNQPIPREVIEDCFRLNREGIYLKDIEKIHNLKRWVIWHYAKKYGIELKKNWNATLDTKAFDSIDTEEKAYWLGFIAADGYVGFAKERLCKFELSLQLSDFLHLEKFKNFLKYSKPIRTDSYRCRIQFMNSHLVERLEQLGIVNRKSLILKFPTDNQVPKKLLIHYIRGYFDGDGSITKPNRVIHVQLAGTKEYLEILDKEIDLNGTISKHNMKNDHNTFILHYHGDRARFFLDQIYENSNIHLNRKYEIYQQRKAAYTTGNNSVKWGKIGEVHHCLDNTERDLLAA